MPGYLGISKSTEWLTPTWIIDSVKNLFNGSIGLDPAGNINSRVVPERQYILPQDGLIEPWNVATIYCNPPFGRTYLHKVTKEVIPNILYQELTATEKECYYSTTIANWVKKAWDTYYNDNNKQLILLIPAAVDTAHWHKWIFPLAQNSWGNILFFKGRIKFVGAKAAAPMAMSLVYMGRRSSDFKDEFYKYGAIL